MNNKACRASRLFFLNGGLAVSSWAPMVPFVKRQLDLNGAELGLLLLLIGIGGLISMPLSGFLVNRYGSNKLIPIGSALLVIILPFLALASSILHLSVILFIFGSVLGVLNVSINSQAITVEKQVQRPIMSGFHCLFSFGGLIGAASIAFLLEMEIPLIWCILLLSTYLAIITITQSKYLLDDSLPVVEGKSTGFTFPRPMVFFLGLLCFISFLAEGAILDWSAILLHSTHGYEISIAGIGYAFFSVAMTLARFSGDFLKKHFSDVFMIRAGGAVAAAGIFIATNFHWAHIELLGFFLVGIGAANIVPTLFSAAGRMEGTSPSIALTTMTTMGYIGLFIGPAIIGFVADAASLPLALSGVAILLVLIAICGKSIESSPILQKI
ncbi:MAG: MFS transporter [Parachlamydiaceae bacterium]|nr:MFS transporter [Parachlamydiaceae bacterium]